MLLRPDRGCKATGFGCNVLFPTRTKQISSPRPVCPSRPSPTLAFSPKCGKKFGPSAIIACPMKKIPKFIRVPAGRPEPRFEQTHRRFTVRRHSVSRGRSHVLGFHRKMRRFTFVKGGLQAYSRSNRPTVFDKREIERGWPRAGMSSSSVRVRRAVGWTGKKKFQSFKINEGAVGTTKYLGRFWRVVRARLADSFL